MKKLCFGILFLISVMILLIVLTGCQKTGQAYDIITSGQQSPGGAYNVENRVLLIDENGNQIGETGLIKSVTHSWRWAGFNKSYNNPVVIAKPVSFEGKAPGHARIKRVVGKGFAIRIEEWFYLDGNHAGEDVSFIVIETGDHKVGGKRILAGKTNSYINENFKPIEFIPQFNNPPIMLTQTQTLNGVIPIVTRLKGVGTQFFGVRIQQEEAKKYGSYDVQLESETIGYIAVEPGMFVSDGRKHIASNTHNNYTHKWTEIKFGFTPGAFIADAQTQNGGDVFGLRYKNLQDNSVEVKIEEEKSKDKETGHTKEVIGYLVVETDSDADGIPDTEDICPGHDDSVDIDNDGVPDGCDNCPEVYNPEQEDADDDKVGNACDNCWNIKNNNQTETGGSINCDERRDETSYMLDEAWIKNPRCGDACDPPLFCIDEDGDNFAGTGAGCDPASSDFDCNDTSGCPSVRIGDCSASWNSVCPICINPDAVERCDGIDNNCDGQIDEGLSCGCMIGSTDYCIYPNGCKSARYCKETSQHNTYWGSCSKKPCKSDEYCPDGYGTDDCCSDCRSCEYLVEHVYRNKGTPCYGDPCCKGVGYNLPSQTICCNTNKGGWNWINNRWVCDTSWSGPVRC